MSFWQRTRSVNRYKRTKNKFPQHILFPEIYTYFEITASKPLLIVRSVLNFVYIRLKAEFENIKHIVENLHVSNFQRLTNQIPCYYSYLFRIQFDVTRICHEDHGPDQVYCEIIYFRGAQFLWIHENRFIRGDVISLVEWLIRFFKKDAKSEKIFP